MLLTNCALPVCSYRVEVNVNISATPEPEVRESSERSASHLRALRRRRA